MAGPDAEALRHRVIRYTVGMDEKDEPVGTLEGETIDRVILQDETRLYRAKVVLTYLDGPVYDFGPTDVMFQNPVKVYDDDMKQLGFASLDLEETPGDQRLTAEISIDYSCQERLLIETEAKFYARVFGKMAVPAMPLFDFQAPVPIIRLIIDGIQISTQRPADPRISHVGAPVV